MAIEGSLSDVSLADICQLLSLGRKTGCLTATHRSRFGYIYFENGRVIFASLLNQPDRLGELLVKNGAIKREELAEAMEVQGREADRRVGEILVSLGALTPEEVERWVTIQIEEAVYHLFTWTEGSFHFKVDELPDEDSVLLVSLSADGLLMEGARRVDEWSQIEKKIPSLDLIFKLVRDPQKEEGLELSRTQEKLLPLLVGTRTVAELVDDSGLVEFETGKALYELIQAGFLQQVGKKAPEEKSKGDALIRQHLNLGQAFFKAGMMEDAAEEFEGVLAGDPTHPLACFRLAVIRLVGGDARAALEHLDALPQEYAKGYAVLRNRALALEHLGRFGEALEVLTEAGTIKRGDPSLTLTRGITELRSGKPLAARDTFRRYRKELKRNTPPAVFYPFAVLASAIAGHLDEAVILGREGLQAYPAEASILVNTGAVLDRKGDHEAAEQYFLRVLTAGSEVPAQAHKNLGDQAFRRGDKAGAQTHYTNAVQADPALGDDVFMKLGLIAQADEDEKMAELFLRRAIELNPRNEKARSQLAGLSAIP